MARPYSDDLRRKLLEAFDQGNGSLSELAEDFGVSLGWAWKISAARKRTGRMERPGYARCTGGARIHETTPDGRWKILTILGAICTRGMIATMTIEAATDREIFLAYLDEVLCPKLRIGDVVIMDNLSSHKVKGVRERIEAAGAQLLYLPPYSPDLNPIEKAWAKLKQLLRAAKARTKQALDQAIAELLPMLTAEDARAWFRLPFSALQQ